MKHIMNLLITLILTGFAVGISWLTWNSPSLTNTWSILYIPWFVLTILWGRHITNKY